MYFVDITLTVKIRNSVTSECMLKESPRIVQILSRWDNDKLKFNFIKKMFLTHKYISGIGSVPTIYNVYDLLSVIVGVYSVCNDKPCGNFPFNMLIEYSSVGTCAHQFSTLIAIDMYY